MLGISSYLPQKESSASIEEGAGPVADTGKEAVEVNTSDPPVEAKALPIEETGEKESDDEKDEATRLEEKILEGVDAADRDMLKVS